MNQSKPHKLLRDGEVVLKFANSWDVYKYIHNQHSYSLDHALKYEGYEIQLNLGTGESK